MPLAPPKSYLAPDKHLVNFDTLSKTSHSPEAPLTYFNEGGRGGGEGGGGSKILGLKFWPKVIFLGL